MAAKQEVIGHVNDVEFVVNVESAQRVQHLDFNERLMMKPEHRHHHHHRHHRQQQQQQRWQYEKSILYSYNLCTVYFSARMDSVILHLRTVLLLCCCTVCTALLFSYSAIFIAASVRNKLIHHSSSSFINYKLKKDLPAENSV